MQIIETPGHTPGTISLLDEKNGFLFSGDTIVGHGILLNLPESSDVESFRDTIYLLEDLAERKGFTQIFGGLGKTPAGTVLLKIFEEICDQILNGEISDKDLKKGVLEYKNVTISFNPQNITKEEVKK